MSHPDDAPLLVVVAGVAVSLRVPPGPARGRISRRVEAFRVDALPPGVAAYDLRVEGAPRVQGRLPLKGVLEDGRVRVVDAGEPWLELDPADPARPIRIPPHASLGCVDVLLRTLVTLRALERGGCALHAAAVAVDDGVHLFAGPSGAGKSSVAEQLRREGAMVMSDELVVVEPAAGASGFVVHGTPFWHGTPATRGPVVAAWRLHQGGHGVVPIRPAELLRHLAANLSLVVEGAELVGKSLGAVAGLAASVKGCELQWMLGQPIRSLVEGPGS